jgi:Flp pilus assembly protein TadD
LASLLASSFQSSRAAPPGRTSCSASVTRCSAFAFIFYGQRRQNAVEAAVRRGERTPLDARVMAALTAAGIMLGVATIAVVLFTGS